MLELEGQPKTLDCWNLKPRNVNMLKFNGKNKNCRYIYIGIDS